MKMDLQLPPAPSHFKSPARKAGISAELWAAHNLFCPCCGSSPIDPAPVNTTVWDFRCRHCEVRIQLKAKAGRFGGAFQNSAYAPKISAIRERRLPDYALLSYDSVKWVVTDLTVIPGHFIAESHILARRPLSESAKRAGWVGSVVKLGELPPDALIRVIEHSIPVSREEVIERYAQFRWLGAMRATVVGWTADVLSEVRRLAPYHGATFTTQDLYAVSVPRLSQRHPRNHHVKEKIRQQLQVLRDHGVLAFDRRGVYRVVG